MRIAFGFVALGFLVMSHHAQARDLSGVWVAHKLGTLGDALGINDQYGVSFIKDGDVYCGVLSWLKPPRNTKEKDVKNPKRALRDRPLLGITILKNLRANGEDELIGEMYYWRKGKNVTAKISFSGATNGEICSTSGAIEALISCLNLTLADDSAHKPQTNAGCQP